MAKDFISEWDATAANNSVIADIDIAEDNLPSTINNAIRELMAQVKDAFLGDQAYDSLTAGITAGSTQTQAGATALTTTINQVTVSGTNGDGVALPANVAGCFCFIANDDAAQTIQVWPASGASDTIDGGSADAVDANTIPAGGARVYYALNGTDWRTLFDQASLSSLGIANHDNIIVSAAGEVTIPTQPLVIARVTGDIENQTGAGTAYTVVFGTEIVDQNADFSSTTFTAPVTGNYRFSGVLQVYSITAAMTTAVVSLVTSNRTYILFEGDPQAMVAASNALTMPFNMLADMDASDTATITLKISNGAGDTAGLSGGPTQSFLTVELAA